MDELEYFTSSPLFAHNPQPSSSAEVIDLTDNMNAPKEAVTGTMPKVQKVWTSKPFFC